MVRGLIMTDKELAYFYPDVYMEDAWYWNTDWTEVLNDWHYADRAEEDKWSTFF